MLRPSQAHLRSVCTALLHDTRLARYYRLLLEAGHTLAELVLQLFHHSIMRHSGQGFARMTCLAAALCSPSHRPPFKSSSCAVQPCPSLSKYVVLLLILLFVIQLFVQRMQHAAVFRVLPVLQCARLWRTASSCHTQSPLLLL